MYSMMPVHDACFVMHHDVVKVKQDDQMTYHKALAMSSVPSLLPKVPNEHLFEFSMPSALYYLRLLPLSSRQPTHIAY